jgi:Domain of unknown function DUF29
MSTQGTLYDTDFYAWTQEQGALLRAGKVHELDLAHVQEEIEGLGQSQQNALESRLLILLRHLLKWRYQPDKRMRGHSWQSSIVEQRFRIDRLLRKNPSLRPTVPGLIEELYPFIRYKTSLETRLPEATFPPVCPWRAEEILDADFWPEAEPTS